MNKQKTCWHTRPHDALPGTEIIAEREVGGRLLRYTHLVLPEGFRFVGVIINHMQSAIDLHAEELDQREERGK